jgi:hypothetical protein
MRKEEGGREGGEEARNHNDIEERRQNNNNPVNVVQYQDEVARVPRLLWCECSWKGRAAACAPSRCP